MRAPASSGRPHFLFLWLAVATFALDQLSKLAALAFLPTGSSRPLLDGVLRLTLTHNTAGAFGFFPGGWPAIAVSALISVAIIVYCLTGNLVRAPGRALPLALITGGALGNLLDRLRTGGVIDFLDLRVWPVFNVADIGITIGAALLALELIRRKAQ